jgi:hypothetical protein
LNSNRDGGELLRIICESISTSNPTNNGAPQHQNDEMGWRTTVDNFVTAKAPNFNSFQSTSTSETQTIQQQSLRINKNP